MADRETYGEILADLVDEMARFEDRAEIFRKAGISRNHFYNVINPNRTSSGGQPFYCPTEWGMRLTRDSGSYRWIKTVARDCGCIVITPEEIRELKESQPERALELFRSILGILNGKKAG